MRRGAAAIRGKGDGAAAGQPDTADVVARIRCQASFDTATQIGRPQIERAGSSLHPVEK